MTDALLRVSDLTVTFNRRGVPPMMAVDGVSFAVAPGQTVGLVGESGCGKSVTSLTIMRLLPRRGNSVTGAVEFEGADLLGLSMNDMRDRRGRDLAMIFQDPAVLAEPGGAHRDPGRRGAGAASRDEAIGGDDRGAGSARLGRHPRPGKAAEGVPAPAVRRDAAAGADRHGAGLPAPFFF